MKSWSIFLPGRVPTKGSFRSTGGGRLRNDCSWLGPWTGKACADILASDPPTWKRHEPVSVEIQITVERPASHFNKAGGLNATGREYPAPTRRADGDEDKHRRAVYDLLTMARVLADDADIVSPGRDSWMQWSTELVPAGLMLTVSDFLANSHLVTTKHYGIREDCECHVRFACRPLHRYSVIMHADYVTASKYAVSCRLCRAKLGL